MSLIISDCSVMGKTDREPDNGGVRLTILAPANLSCHLKMKHPNTLSSQVPHSRKDPAPPMKYSCQKDRTWIYRSLSPTTSLPEMKEWRKSFNDITRAKSGRLTSDLFSSAYKAQEMCSPYLDPDLNKTTIKTFWGQVWKTKGELGLR